MLKIALFDEIALYYQTNSKIEGFHSITLRYQNSKNHARNPSGYNYAIFSKTQ